MRLLPSGLMNSRLSSLMNSRLSRRIVLSVFLSIVTIEVVILIPSYYRREQELLKQLETLSEEVLTATKSIVMEHQNPEQGLIKATQGLNPDSVILGGILYNRDGQAVGMFGQDLPTIPVSELWSQDIVRRRTQSEQRYDVAWPSHLFSGRYVLVVRHDASQVPVQMIAYAARIMGLVILISAFVTLVTMLVLEKILITPILRLRDDLHAAAAAVSQSQDPNFYTLSLNRTDELGEVAAAFGQMFFQIQREIRERQQMETALRSEKEKSERLLLNVLPAAIATKLKERPGIIASRANDATILFADIVDFTGLAAKMPPSELVYQLNLIFSVFDALADSYGLEKIKTIGDAYMVVGGLPTPRSDHAEAILEMAIEMQRMIGHFKRQDGEPFQIRIGINTGPVVAGVIGRKKFSYDLWGDAVNVASRMESHGLADQIQVTEATYERLKHKYVFEERGPIWVKGRGEMRSFLWVGCHDDNPLKQTPVMSSWHPPQPQNPDDARLIGRGCPSFRVNALLPAIVPVSLIIAIGYLAGFKLTLDRQTLSHPKPVYSGPRLDCQ